MKIDKKIIEVCKQNFISLDALAYLYSVATANDWEVPIDVPSLHKLRVMGFLDEKGDTTEEALLLLSNLSVSDNKIITEDYSKEFEEFWKAFPSTNGYNRELKGNKRLAFTNYKAALARGSTPKQILDGLNNEISIKTNSLQGLRYMRGVVNWLKLETFKDYTNHVGKTRGTKIA